MFVHQTVPPEARLPPSTLQTPQVLLTEAMEKAKKAAELQARIQMQLVSTGLDASARTQLAVAAVG